MEKQFSIRESLKSSWNLISGENLFLLIGLYLGYMILTLIVSSFSSIMPNGIITLLEKALEVFISVVWSLGIVKIYLQISNDDEPQFSSFKEVLPMFWRYLGAAILKSLPVIVLLVIALGYAATQVLQGMSIDYARLDDQHYVNSIIRDFNPGTGFIWGFVVILLPILYLQIRWMFYTYLIVDKNAGAIESLQQSWLMTEGNFWHLFLYVLVCMGLIVAGVIALVIGILVALPLIIMMQTLIYKKLVSKLTVETEIAEVE